MALTLSIADVAARDRVDFLYDTVWNNVLPVEMTFTPDPVDIDVEFRVTEAGPINLSSARSSANALYRTPALVRRDHVPQLFLAVQTTGTTVVSQAGSQAVLRPGDMVVYDSTRPYSVENRELTELHYVRIPRDALALPSRRLEPLLGVRMGPDTNPLAAAVGSFFTTLAATSALDRPDAARAVAGPGIDLVRALLAVQAGDDDTAPAALEGSLVARVRRYVADHLTERDLTPGRIAAAHHVSLRHLYAVLAREGVGLHATIQEQRLDGCARALRDPTQAHLAVAIIGSRWGFVDPSHFGRAFKRAYGMTPNEWRRTRPDTG
ncbi:helix-turn-helix domain-containing protein [Actinomycetospora sp. TBRC 11914]|uniref:AraC-like ligand-binding domain-containing protein n=1 Tax=Actinomycetospora sp. TBRC 11914 TaxID=2729387 RepID=UPI00145F6DEB|nr:helix-turn-helix domain-containing protein [Actinomycetospora sp. TBRC 11914]NMO89355.1 helix-turn-helix domain-containing protein [Actinomycetospora sp. TBRC 11914]